MKKFMSVVLGMLTFFTMVMPGLVPIWADETFTYTNVALKKTVYFDSELGTPYGEVGASLVDGSNNTYTILNKNAVGNYSWFVIDLGDYLEIDHVDLTRRSMDTNGWNGDIPLGAFVALTNSFDSSVASSDMQTRLAAETDMTVVGTIGTDYYGENVLTKTVENTVTSEKFRYVMIYRQQTTDRYFGFAEVSVFVKSGYSVSVADQPENADGNPQFIDISYSPDTLGDNIKETLSLKDADGLALDVPILKMANCLKIPLASLSSDTTYTLAITPEGLTPYTKTFTTGTILPRTDAAEGAEMEAYSAENKVFYAVDLKRGYDLDSVSVEGENTEGASVYLTRSFNAEDFSGMTLLKTLSADEESLAVQGDSIGKYRYVIVAKDSAFTVTKISAIVSNESMKGVKPRPIGGTVDFRFASFSDLHNTATTENATLNTVLSGLKTLGSDIDALAMVGDIVYWTPGIALDDFDTMNARYDVIENALNAYGFNNKKYDKTDGIPTLHLTGNHEYRQGDSNGQENGDLLFRQNAGELLRHEIVNGYHLIGASCDMNARLTKEAADWMQAEIEKAKADDPTGKKPIFLFAHAPTPNTIYNKYSSGTANYYNLCPDFVQYLKTVPQAVFISGHKHFPLQNQAIISQNGYTQVLDGFTGGGYLTADNGVAELNIEDIKKEYHTQGLIGEVKNNVVYLYRMDLIDGAQIGDPWVIDIEGLSDGTTEEYYTNARYTKSKAPYFEADDTISATVNEGDVTLTFPQAKCEDTYDDGFVTSYEVRIYRKKSGKIYQTYGRYSDYIYMNEKHTMSETQTIKLPTLPQNQEYEIEVYAVNSFLKFSEPLTTTVSLISQASPLPPEEQSKEKPEADILSADFYTGSTTDGVHKIDPMISGNKKIHSLPTGEKYAFFNGLTSFEYSVPYASTTQYSLECSFNAPLAQPFRLIGNDAHNLSLDKDSNVVFTYTTDGTVKTLRYKIPLENWTHVVAVCDGSSAKLYVDNIPVAQAQLSGNADPLSGNIFVGTNAFVSMLKGRVFGRSLSVGEVDKLMLETDNLLEENYRAGQVELVSLNKTATKTKGGTYRETTGPENLIDNNISNYAVASTGNESEFVIDLGRLYDLDAFVLYQRTYQAGDTKNLNIAISEEYEEDASARTLIYTADENGFTQGLVPNYIDVPEGKQRARYVYLYRDAGWTVINEFSVFGQALDERKENRIDFVEVSENKIQSVTISAGETAPETCSIMIAVYNENGGLVSITENAGCVLLKDGTQQTIVLSNSPTLSEGQVAKLFVWDGLQNVIPITSCRCIK